MSDLTFITRDSENRLPRIDLVGRKLLHTGNGKTYLVSGVCWLGATDEWGYLHAEIRADGFPGVTIARPLSHLTGFRSDGEERYQGWGVRK